MPGETDSIEGDLVIISGPRTMRFSSCGLLLEDLCRGRRCERSSMAGFFFFVSCGDSAVPSMSSSALAFDGRPFAIAELEVCWEIERGSFDLS